jgi:hypothetical protein
MSTYLRVKKSVKRKRGREPLVDGELDSSEAVTHTRMAVTQDDGTVVMKHVLESLDTPPQRLTAEPNQVEIPPSVDNANYEQIQDMSPPPIERSRKSRVSIFFLEE